ncbi:MAG: hypothetical protein KBT87_07490 [Gammaproteobacteria bacterium]|nr:hypothetical protein [Gammaproteobacteria bacterium]MBQ0774495.1 hypothetical protein [Gammaproteobacteria bacterium]
MKEIRENPFDCLKATDFSDVEIFDFWVGLIGQRRLEDILSPLSTMPMMLLGGKGSGKTHLMRYCSSAVQRLRGGGNLAEAIRQDGYMGIYVRADALNVNRFRGKGFSEDQWSAIFYYYFEIRLGVSFLRECQQAIADGALEFDVEGFISGFRELSLGSDIISCDRLDGVIDHLIGLRKEVDRVVANVATGRSSLQEIVVRFRLGDLAFGLPALMKDSCADFSETKFVFMIDELENFSPGQQEFVNSLIRYRRGAVSIKVGARHYGIKTYGTIEGGEPIKLESEFTKVILEDEVRQSSSGPEFLKNLISVRLEKSGWGARSSGIDPYDYFQNLGGDDDLNAYLFSLIKNRNKDYSSSGHVRRFFEALSDLSKSEGVSEDKIKRVVGILSFEGKPLWEKLAYLSFYKQWEAGRDPIQLAESIRGEIASGVEGRQMTNRYSQFKTDLCAQLIRESTGKRVMYFGLDTIIDIAQFTPRNLFILLKSIFRRSRFNNERPFEKGSEISIISQNEGILDAADWFWEDAQPDVHGAEVRSAIDSIAQHLSNIRFAANPPECSLSTFSVVGGSISSEAAENLRHALNWSYLYEISQGGVDKNQPNLVNRKFQISPMLSPKYGLSVTRRGVITIDASDISDIFLGRITEVSVSMKKKIRGYQRPLHAVKDVQEDLFNGAD